MSIRLARDEVDASITIFQFENPWTWDELFVVMPQFYRWLDEAAMPVDSIILLEDFKVLPPLVSLNANRLSLELHVNSGAIVVVSRSHFVRLMIAVLQRMNDPIAKKIKFAATLDEAREMLHGGC